MAQDKDINFDQIHFIHISYIAYHISYHGIHPVLSYIFRHIVHTLSHHTYIIISYTHHYHQFTSGYPSYAAHQWWSCPPFSRYGVIISAHPPFSRYGGIISAHPPFSRYGGIISATLICSPLVVVMSGQLGAVESYHHTHHTFIIIHIIISSLYILCIRHHTLHMFIIIIQFMDIS